MEENEFTYIDRLSAIKEADKRFDLRTNAYLSFSGGKDSTILHYLLDLALPENSIPRVFIDTGIEYKAIRDYVYFLAQKDDRIQIIKPTKPIKEVLEKHGYPFKSKEFSNLYAVFQRSGKTKSVLKFLNEYSGANNRSVVCPNALKPLFDDKPVPFKVSDECCLRLKKKPIKEWEKENNRHIAMTGMRREEGGQRMSLKGCIITDKDGNATKFHALLNVSDDWEDWFIAKFQVKLCELYYPPFNFKRTGCKGCPFSLDLQCQLATMEVYMSGERKQCEIIWKPVYDLYRELDYRLDKNEQGKLF